jgi:hypothetical protein
MRADNPRFTKTIEWDERKVSILRSMLAEGASFREIGGVIGCSRNAALGKAHRLGLYHPSRTHQTQRRGSDAPVRRKHRAKTAAELDAKPKKRVPIIPALTKWRGAPDPETLGVNTAYIEGDAWAALPGSNPVPMADHVNGCRWPIGDGPNLCLCNNTPRAGSRYCEDHYQRSRGSF